MTASRRLLVDDAEIQAIRGRIERNDWAATALDGMRGRLEARRRELLPVDPSGEPAFERGGERATVLLELAVAGQLAGGWYHQAAARIVDRVTDLVGFVGQRVDPNSGFNYGLNGLMIAHAAVEICLALDFLGEIPAGHRQRLCQAVLIPIGERLDRDIRRGGSNWQVVENTALLAVGLVADRPDFIEVVRSDPQRGYPYHLANSVHPDGFWFEQTAGYHQYALRQLLLIRLMAGRHDLGLGGDETLQRMIACLFRLALPGGQLPRLGDCHSPSLFNAPHGPWELAYAFFRDPSVGWVLSRGKRHSLDALLFGREVTGAQAPPVRSEVLEASGLAVLKIGAGPAYWEGQGSGATVTFGPHGDWHGHPGKLGVEFWHDRDYLIRDREIGSGYALPMHRQWYATSAAHSTVVIDGCNQAHSRTRDRPELEKNERGVCHAQLLRPDVAACTVSADFAFPGCRCRRTLFLTADYLLDLFECAALDGREHTFDWWLHTDGLLEMDLPLTPRTPGFAGNGYDYLRRTEGAVTDGDWHADVIRCSYKDSVEVPGGRTMRVSMAGQPATTVIRGLCPAPERDRWSPVLIIRRRAMRTVFAALYVPAPLALSFDCSEPLAGALTARVAHESRFDDRLFKQDHPRLVTIEGRPAEALLGYARREVHSSPSS